MPADEKLVPPGVLGRTASASSPAVQSLACHRHSSSSTGTGHDKLSHEKKNTSRVSQEIKKKIRSLGVEWMQQEWSFLLASTENEGSTGKLCAPLDGAVNQS